MGSAVAYLTSKKAKEEDSNLVVSTSLGRVKGVALEKAKCDEAKQVFAYMGLPFAKPPLGELRFEPPQRTNPWDGVLDATKTPAEPVQSTLYGKEMLEYWSVPLVCNEDTENMSEDCLYLNVYTTNPKKKAKMPVLFWIFGGAFNMGGAIGYNGQVLCGLHDVVLVVPQYRVNVFGFFTTGKDTKWPGNMGMLDQVMALEWTRDNIASFGGDPDNVTIFGESSGSISVSMHVTSPMSRGLFHRAISHSGVATMESMMKPDMSLERNLILEALGITSTEPEKILKELKAVDAKKIVKVLDENPQKTMMVPTIDGMFIPKHTTELLQEGNFNPVQYIIGLNNTEASGLFGSEFPESFQTGLDEKTAKDTVQGMLAEFLPPEKTEAVTQAVMDFYNKELDDDKYKWSRVVASINSDSYFAVPSIQQALAHSDAGNDTYVYYMTQQLCMHHDQAYAGGMKQKPEFCEADHGDDVFFTFGYPFINGKFNNNATYSKDEMNLSKLWMKSICQFAKTGNPNCDGETEWPKYDSKTKKHLVLKWPYDVGSNLLESRMKFWSETFPSLLE